MIVLGIAAIAAGVGGLVLIFWAVIRIPPKHPDAWPESLFQQAADARRRERERLEAIATEEEARRVIESLPPKGEWH